MKPRTIALAAVAAAVLVPFYVVGMVDGATSPSSPLALQAGQSGRVTCSGGTLSLGSLSASGITATCTGSTTTTTTTTTVPSTTTTTQPTSGNCTSPIYTTSNAEGTINTDPSPAPENYWVNNDAWNGSHGPQTLSVCSASSWYAVSNQPNNGGQVETFPDTEFDVGGRNTLSTEPITGFTSITSTYADVAPAAGGYDFGYDLWSNYWQHEVMIWTSWGGSNSYWPNLAASSAGKSLTLDGVPYDFYANGSELMLFPLTQSSSGSVDILAAFKWLVANGYLASTDEPTQLEFGVEISYTSGPETFATTGLSFSLSS